MSENECQCCGRRMETDLTENNGSLYCDFCYQKFVVDTEDDDF